jgi:Raf kinase inhibitor-like YbhB/YbcL family protein
MKPLTLIITIIIILVIIGIGYRIAVKPNTTADVNVSLDATPTATPTASPTPTVNSQFTLMSSAFTDGAKIPMQYTCEGAGTQPPLSWSATPSGTQSLALTMYDPDVPKQVQAKGYFDHWVLFNIPATTTNLTASTTVGVAGNNGSGKAAYTGPCPPTNYEPKEHRYIFTLYALDQMLGLKKGATRADVEKAAIGHTIATTTLMGRYQKTK